MELTKEKAEIVCLIKPQFEAGREKVGKHGVVRDIQTHLEVVKDIAFFAKGLGLKLRGLSYSPIKGPEGNIEYLIYLIKDLESDDCLTEEDMERIVTESHFCL